MGKRSWEPENLTNKYEFIETEEFRKIIVEVAEIVYSDFCQLPEDSLYCASQSESKTLEKAA